MSLADDFPSNVCNFTLRLRAFARNSGNLWVVSRKGAKAERSQRKNAQQNYRSYKPSKEV